jgi:hypothetical protein
MALLLKKAEFENKPSLIHGATPFKTILSHLVAAKPR